MGPKAVSRQPSLDPPEGVSAKVDSGLGKSKSPASKGEPAVEQSVESGTTADTGSKPGSREHFMALVSAKPLNELKQMTADALKLEEKKGEGR